MDTWKVPGFEDFESPKRSPRTPCRAGTEPRLELKFRLEVNKGKARAQSRLKTQSSDELFGRLDVGLKVKAGSKDSSFFFKKLKLSKIFCFKQMF